MNHVTCLNCRYSMPNGSSYFCCYYRKCIWGDVKRNVPAWCTKFKDTGRNNKELFGNTEQVKTNG